MERRLRFSKPSDCALLLPVMSKASTQRKERVILSALMGGLLLSIVFFGGLIIQTYREYKHFKEQEAMIQAKFIQARKEFEQKELYLSQMLNDAEFIERVARERLGYARPDEMLFRFSDE